MISKVAKLTIPTPHNCLECEILKEWYGTRGGTHSFTIIVAASSCKGPVRGCCKKRLEKVAK